MSIGMRQLFKRMPGAVPAVRRVRRRWRMFRWYHIRALRRGYPPKGNIYQSLDWEVVDYEPYSLPNLPPYLLPGLPLNLRGPAPRQLATGGYITCVGAAQTFGRFCDRPYPELLSQDLGIPTVNLGFGGAEPQLFLRHPKLIELMNESRLVILQVMSARNEDNSLFEGGGSGSLKMRSTGERMRAEAAYGHLLESSDPTFVKSIVRETRDTWLESYQRLLSRIRVPTVLLWFSVRQPDYTEQYNDVRALFGEFPHLVNKQMAEIVSSNCDAYAHCVTDRGLPQQLRSRFSGRPTRVMGVRGGALLTENRYYPSPEMHQDAAAVLEPICQRFLRLER